VNGCTPPASQQLQKNGWIERVNSLGIDVGKKKCRAALKGERGDIIREFFFSNNKEGISTLIQSASHYGKCTAVVESTGNMWIRIHDTLDRYHISSMALHYIKVLFFR
jgi:transposase